MVVTVSPICKMEGADNPPLKTKLPPTYIDPVAPMPPVTTNAPVAVEPDRVPDVIATIPAMLVVDATFNAPDIPTPPVTINAPEIAFVDVVALVIDCTPVNVWVAERDAYPVSDDTVAYP